MTTTNTSIDMNNLGAEQRYHDANEHAQHVASKRRPVEWVRISKREAQRLFAEGDKPIFLCPCKLRPGFPWNVAVHVFGQPYLEDAQRQGTPEGLQRYPTLESQAWTLMYNNWAYYNVSHETGYYAHYYVQR